MPEPATPAFRIMPDVRPADGASAVDAAILTRRSIRAFLDRPVPLAMVEDILSVARWAPSSSNMQPWRCYVVIGETRRRLTEAAVNAFQTATTELKPEYAFFPDPVPEPHHDRRIYFRSALSAALGIDRSDKVGRTREEDRQFMFFGAPVGIIFTIDRRLERSNFLCYGAFLQSIMLAARARGLDTCLQQMWSRMHHVIRRHLPIPDGEMVVAGMSLGWGDRDAAENRFARKPAETAEFVTILD